MNKTELVKKISEKTGETQTKVSVMLEGFLESVKDSLAAGEGIELKGFGSFKIKDRAARSGVNPKTGEKIKIAAMKAASFVFSKVVKDLVNNKKK